MGYAASQSFEYTTWFAPSWIFLPLLIINLEQVYICIRRSREVSADTAKYNTVTSLGEYEKPPSDQNPGSVMDDESDVCVICLANFETGDVIRKLPCSHVYHKACIDDYFRRQVSVAYNSSRPGISSGGVLPPRHPLCAVCRSDIFNPPEIV